MVHLAPSRTFVDGQLFDELSVVGKTGEQQKLRDVFCTNRLLEPLNASGPKELYVWNRHIFAVNEESGLTEDIEGVKMSYLYRDRFLLLLLAASIVMFPYAAWVLIKKLIAIRSLPKFKNDHAVA